MVWFKKKELCVHCRKEKTKRTFENSPTCYSCQIKILIGREKIYNCPVDGSKMIKSHLEGLIIDRCQECGGVWLDKGELEEIQEAMQNESSSQFATGLAIGLTISSIKIL